MIEKNILFNGYGSLSPSLFVIHSTANPGATVQNHLSYWQGLVNSGQTAYYTHFITDWTKSVQCVETNRLCYHCGNGNSVSIGMEICEATAQADFNAGWENAVSAAAEVLTQMGWGVDAMVTHKYMSENYGGSDHTDPIPYFTKWGKTWENFVTDVAEQVGEEVTPLPDPMIPDYAGLYNCFTYMGWQLVTAEDSKQYKLRAEAGQQFNGEGFGIINNCYVIAVTQTVGEVGDFLDVTLASGEVLHCVVGDIKSATDPNITPWGHIHGNALSVVEFVVDYNTWYSNGSGSHANPGTNSCHPEWSGKIQQIQWVGNWWGRVPTPNPSPNNPTSIPWIRDSGNLRIVQAYRLVDGSKRQCTFVGSVQADNYLYFNDDLFYRIWKDSPLQVLAKDKHSWTYSNTLTDIKVYEVNFKSLTALQYGAGAWSPPTTGSDWTASGAGVEDAIQWALAVAKDETHGYDQTNRWGPDYDCASFLYEAFRVGGGFSGLPVHDGKTDTMITHFTANGFEWLEGIGNNMSALQRGDILLNIVNHTELYLGNGQNVGAHINELGTTVGGQTGDQSGDEISVGSWYSFPWDGVLRYAG